jgi:hypothetical protein
MARSDHFVVTRDGRDAMLFRPESQGWYQSGDNHVVHFTGRRGSPQEGAVALFTVQITGTAADRLEQRPLVPGMSLQEGLELVADAAIGDHLDGLEGVLEEGSPVQEIVCRREYVDDLAKRKRVPDLVAVQYLAAKTYWAKRRHQVAGVITYADAMRLGQTVADLRVLADTYLDELWTYYADPSFDGFILSPTQELLKSGPKLEGPTVSGPIFDISDRLTDARYAPSMQQLRKAYRFLQSSPIDCENAAKEAVGALESMARRVSGESTLGRAVPTLKDRDLVDETTAKILTNLYEYRNRTPGVGHGGLTPGAAEITEARLIVNLCAAALLYLVELDG